MIVVLQVVANAFRARNGTVAVVVANHGTRTAEYAAHVEVAPGHVVSVTAVTLPPCSARAVLVG